MAEPSFNPYAAPAESGSVAPADGMWQVGGGVLLFRDGARLPEVDLFSGRSDMALTPAASEFTVAVGGLARIRPLIVGGVAAVAIFGIGTGRWAVDSWVLVAGLLALSLLLRLSAGKGRKARLNWHVSTETERRRRKWNSVAGAIFFLAMAGMVVVAALGRSDWFPLAALVMLLALVGVLVALRRFPRPACVRIQDGWFHLSGVPSEALQVLAGRQSAAMADLLSHPPRTRLRKVCALRLHRMSLPALVGKNWWNPPFVITIFLMKLFRSRKLERDALHWSEAEDLADDSWDPPLRERFDAIRAMPEFAGWRELQARRIGSVVGDVLTQWVTLISPDDHHSLVIAVVRVANARSSGESQESTFRTWLDDGSIRMTSNVRVQRPLPPHFKVRRVNGSPETVWRHHSESLPADRLAAAPFPGGWQQRMVDEMEARHDALVGAGIFGPVREVELTE